MKTLYLKTTMKLLRLLPVLIFFMLAFSYHARSQTALVNPVCYGEPILLACNYTAGCNNPDATFTWSNFSGSWTSSERDPVLNAPGFPPSSAQQFSGQGYGSDKFYLSIQFTSPPNSFFGGRVTVTVLAPIVITGNITPVVCYGVSTGAIDITVAGGQFPYTYAWSNGATTQDLTGLAAGTYTVTVTDGRSCSQISADFVVTEPQFPVSVVGTPVDVACNGGNTGSIDITPSNGTAPYGFIWSNGQTVEDLSNLAAGFYAVTVSDANNCKATGSWSVQQPLYPLAVNGTPVDASCFGYSDGSITAVASGGTTGYTYLWSNGFTTDVITGLAAGCYTVTVTDGNLCTVSGTYCVGQPAVLAAVGQPTSVLCKDDCNGTIDLTVTGGTLPYVFAWSNGASTQNVTGLCEGTHSVTITDAHNCTFTDSYMVGAPLQLAVTGTPVNALCKTSCDGSISILPVGGTAPYGFAWSNGETTQNVGLLCEGTYTVTVTDSHFCTVVESWTVNAPDQLAVVGVPTDALCNQSTDGSINITVSGGTPGYGYMWSNGDTNEDLIGVGAGTYAVTITDQHNCSIVDNWTVNEPGEISWVGVTTDATCFGLCNGTITEVSINGGTPPYTYLWSNGATTKDLTGLCAGRYDLTVTDSHSCDARPFQFINEPEVLVVNPVGNITPATCNGGTGGAIEISVTGGTMPYGYVWSNGATTQNISDLAAGCYTVTVTDAKNCMDTETFCVGEPDAIVATGSATDIICKLDCNGSIDISSVVGGTAPYGFTWSNGATTEDISGLCEGSYSVTVMDAHQCTAVFSWTVGSPLQLAVVGVPTDALCNQSTDGSINITVSGGTPGYGYMWSTGDTNEDLIGVGAGTYAVTITDSHNCTLVDSWTVGEPGEISWVGVTTDATCFGICDGTITEVSINGGTPPYTYLWSNGATTKDLTGLCAGRYDLTVTDSHSCDARPFQFIYEPDVLAVNPVGNITPATCNGGSGGSIEISVTGGTMPYGYVWSNGASTQNIYDLAAGCYTVTVTDANNCMDTETFCVGEPDAIVATGIPTDILCKLDCNGSIDITSVVGGAAPYGFTWSNGATTEDISGLCEGSYSVTVMDAHQCTAVFSWSVGSPLQLAVVGVPTDALCNQSTDGSVSITVSGGTPVYGYMWSNGDTNEDLVGVGAGTYTVTITDSHNCTLVDSWTVGEPGEISWVGVTTDATCFGVCDGTITEVSIDGGTPPYTYLWSNGATTKDLTGLCAGRYDLTVTDSHSCDARPFQFIYEPEVLAINPVGNITPATCNGSTGGAIEITVTGGTLPYSFVWSNNATTQNISDLAAGCYTVTVTDANNCMDTETFCVGEPDAIVATGFATDILCKLDCNGSIDITSVVGGTAPYGFTWSNGATTEDISGLCEGSYSVTVMDAHECIAVFSWTVGSPLQLAVVGVPTDALCNQSTDGSVSITVSGGTPVYGYMWSNGDTNEDLVGVGAGTYTVTITDSHNCTLVDSWTVGEPGEISWVGVTTDVTCFGLCNGTITEVSIDGGTPPYTYLWSNGATTKDLTGLCAGRYDLTVTDSHSCDARPFQFIYEPAVLAINPNATIIEPLCNGDENGSIDISVTGGTTPYGFVWSNGATTEDLTGIVAGCYTVTVTDANNCMDTETFCVGQPDVLAVSGVKTDAVCYNECNGTIDLTVTGGTMPYIYAWSNGATVADLSGLCDGTYFVTITDAHSCEASTSFIITEPTELIIGQPVITNATCFGSSNGSINGGLVTGVPPTILPIPVTGGTLPYSYLWSNGETTDNLCCLPAGCYTVTVTDAHLCSTTATWCITEPTALTIEGAVTSVACNGALTGAIDITVTGGTQPIQSYLWSNGATTEDISGLAAGVYTVTVQDYNGCLATNSWEVFQPTAIVIDPIATITNVSCYGLADGGIEITVTGGTLPYSFAWSNGATTQNISGLTAGCYDVTVTDANNCIANGTWCVTEPGLLELEGSVTSVTCYLGSTGAIDITVTGGTMPYGYAWSNGATTEDLTGLTAGIYMVTVTDAHSCTISESFEVIEPPMWSVGITGPDAACCTAPGYDDYYANVTGVPSDCHIDYEWVVVGGVVKSGWNTSHIVVDWLCCTVGTVTVTATKCDGCFLSSSMDVTVSLPPAPVITGSATVYSGGTDIYCVEPMIAGHLYTWSVVNGDYTTIPGTNCITVTWHEYPACGCAKVIVCETDPITGCTGCDTLYITMLPDPNGISLEGTVSYKNGLPNTPLNGVTVKLRDLTSGQIIGTTVTGPNMNPPLYTGEPGYYAFTNVAAGNYKLEASFNGTWGGNNATDALLIQLEAGSAVPGTYLNGLFRIVADVNASLTVTALDALYVKLRTVGSINSYPAGDWAFENPTVTLPVAAPVDFAGLCYGDVNGSYIPTGLKDVSFLSVIDSETQTVPVEETFTYEIRSNMVAQLGAMTLFMGYDNDRFEVIDVTASSNDEMKYVIENGNVAIAWADTKPMSVRNDDQLFTLTVKAKTPIYEATPIFNVRTGSEFASPTGSRYDNFDLKMSKVITAGNTKEFSIFNYPNPFNVSTKIVYTLPEAGKVTLVITDMFGKTIRTLVDESQTVGTYSIPVNAAELNLTSGVYMYRIEAAGTTENYVKVNKMIFTR